MSRKRILTVVAFALIATLAALATPSTGQATDGDGLICHRHQTTQLCQVPDTLGCDCEES